MKKKIAFWSLYVLIIFIIAEITTRLSGKERTYSEQTSGTYSSYYGRHLPTWYHTWMPNTPIIYDQPEIKCSYPADSLGLREVEIPLARKDSAKRLFVIGDSFVEGDGVTYPYSMPRFLEKKLDSAGLKYEVFDAGVCGSDPFYEYTLLRDKLMRYHPTHVILCINNSDIMDCIFRGGMERFQPDGTTKFKAGPWWGPIYAHCHLFRLIYNCYNPDHNGTFLGKNELQEQKLNASKEINECLLTTKAFCDKNHIKLVVIAHPFPSTFSGDTIDDEVNDLYKKSFNDPFVLINVFPDFGRYLNKNNYLQYGWKINGHFNEKGYHLFSDILFDEANHQYPGFW